MLTSRPMRLARPAALLVLACAPALGLAACGPLAVTSAPTPGPAGPRRPRQRRHPGRRGTPPRQRPRVRPDPRPPCHPPRRTPRRAAPRSRRFISHPATGPPPWPAIHADHVVGTRHPGQLHVAGGGPAVAAGGVITFSCGPRPGDHRDGRPRPRSCNTSAEVVLDGGGMVTLSGGGARRILYMDTCDPAQTWTTSHCQDQADPRAHRAEHDLRRRQLHRADLRRRGRRRHLRPRRPAQGRQLPLHRQPLRPDRPRPRRGRDPRAEPVSRTCPSTSCTAPSRGGVCSNGGALSSIGVSWTVLNSVFTGNQAIGDGANPASAGTPGGGSGGAIYTDGDDYTRDRRRHRDHRQHTPARAAAPSSSSATTRPAR